MSARHVRMLHRDQWRIQDFPDCKGAPTSQLGQKPIFWQDFCQKLNDKLKKLDRKGEGTSIAPPWIRQWRISINTQMCALSSHLRIGEGGRQLQRDSILLFTKFLPKIA